MNFLLETPCCEEAEDGFLNFVAAAEPNASRALAAAENFVAASGIVDFVGGACRKAAGGPLVVTGLRTVAHRR